MLESARNVLGSGALVKYQTERKFRCADQYINSGKKKLISAKQLRTKETKRRVTGSTSDSKEQEPSNDMKRPKLNRIKTFERTEPTLDDVQKPARPELRLVQTLEMTKDHHRHSRTKMTNWKHQEQRGPERRMSNQIYREASFELMQR